MPRRSTSPLKRSPSEARVSAEDVVLGKTGSGDADVVRARYRVDGNRLVKTMHSESSPRRASSLLTEIKSVFLPVGYPHSVRPEYLRFQVFDTLQASCSYLRNILTTSAMLRGAGVGKEAAAPLAAAITWVLRDGFGMFGSLLFSYAAGANFDISVKEWRLFADLINDVGLTLDMLAPLAGEAGFDVVAALGCACKTICGMVAGACRASITAHFALDGNLADVSAKEGAQETAVTLVGLLVGSYIASQLGDSPSVAWMTFLVLTAVHVWANILGVGCLTFDYLNPQRAHLVTRAWVAMSDPRGSSHGQVAEAKYKRYISPSRTSQEERFLGPLLLWLRGPKLGVGLDALLDTTTADGGVKALGDLHDLFQDVEYFLRIDARGRPCVALKTGATDATVLQALLHCASFDKDGGFRLAAGAQKQAWATEMGRPLGSAGAFDAGLRGKRPCPAPAVGGLGAEEKVALRESLKYCASQWPRFEAALRASGWTQAAVRADHCCGAKRVRVQTTS
jgi:hypothetical protein